MIDFEYINHIASLAKLNLNETEKEEFDIYMRNTLEYVEVLKEVNVDSKELDDNIENTTGNLRKDEMKDSFNREDILKNAPSTKDGYFLVSNIMI